jgi:hypothetical protein
MCSWSRLHAEPPEFGHIAAFTSEPKVWPLVVDGATAMQLFVEAGVPVGEAPGHGGWQLLEKHDSAA